MSMIDYESGLALGDRVHVWHHSCSWKRTIGRRLAEARGVPLVDLDALNLLPNPAA